MATLNKAIKWATVKVKTERGRGRDIESYRPTYLSGVETNKQFLINACAYSRSCVCEMPPHMQAKSIDPLPWQIAAAPATPTSHHTSPPPLPGLKTMRMK